MRMKLPAVLAAVPFALALSGASALAQSCPKTGGTLTYVYSLEPTSLSTIATSAVPVALISTKMYESLLNYEGPGLAPKPGLAESWTISDDRKTYTFKLRPGVTWHDGKPFTAEDVKFSVESIIRPYHSRGKTYFGDVAAVETPDPLTVVFRLKAPVPFFMNVFQAGEAPMMPKHGFDGIDVSTVAAVRAAPIMQNPVGTGPFRFKEWRKGSHITLERNPTYWRKGFPCLDQIVQRMMPDGASRAIALETGEVDLAPMSSLPEAEAQRLENMPSLEASQAGAEALGPNMWLEVNMRDKPLADLKVRQALSLALDRERIVDVIWYGQGKPARGPVVSGNAAFNKALKPYEYNPRKANQLLDEAGYPRGANGVRFKITQNFLPYGENWQRLAEYVRQELGKVGISVETQSADLGGWLKAVYTDWSFNLTSTFSHNYSDPSIGVERTFHSDFIRKGATFTNSMGYKNARVDELFRLAAREIDPVARQKQFDELQQILHDEMPVIFLMEMSYTHIWNRKVKGLITNGISMYSPWDAVSKD
ncbi:MAG TPA: ABC transporter substrate-binding protein [Bosea sp. (in: a-proteobacteria)]|uniref:ABC transporter substrate-binding protein n=1 Tax=Bosea sp. (in: a-proteobacteria) TaxID=1871050 RepID=UPI002E0E0734|nr:ABC transporter substrate-binding protein [Bosea sp. (in: a-proteobacteria)]